jgi:hypothetical protein
MNRSTFPRIGALAARALFLAMLFASAAPAADRNGEWRDDLRALATRLEEVHPRFRACGLSPELRAELASLESRVGTLTDAAIATEVQRILAAVGDGHTLLWPFGMKRGELLRLPLSLWWFDEGLYIVRAADRERVGRRVERIGSLPAGEVLERLRPWVSRDNEQQFRWAAPFYATVTDFLVAAGAISTREEATLTLDDGSEVTLRAAAIDPRALELRLPPAGAPDGPDIPFRLTTLPDGAVLVELNAIEDGADRTLADFGRDLGAALRTADRAILELRRNNGGEARKANEVLRSLIAFDARGGRIAVLVGRMTFSAAQTLATRLDEWTGALFVGEPTGSRPNHLGNERNFTLPHSGLRGSIASGVNQPITANDMRDAIEPEVPVPSRAADFFAGRDPALDAARKVLKEK